MNFILFDDPSIRTSLLPLTFTRPVAGIRVGIFTIWEKWKNFLNKPVSVFTEMYLQNKYPLLSNQEEENLFINGAVCPSEDFLNSLLGLEYGEALVQDSIVLGYKGSFDNNQKNYVGELTIIRNPWDIFINNGKEIRTDFQRIVSNKESLQVPDKHTIVYNIDNVFIEEGVKVKASVLNAENGPIYLGKNSEVQEGSLIKGPFALCEGAVVNMGGKMKGDSTIGPFSKVGGEVSNSVIFGYSNKGHDGFIGNTVIGEWCNLGADTNTSNLKNNYGQVDVYSYAKKGTVSTGQQFCGLIMGDHSKSGINTMFNTGTVVGVCANIFGAGFPPKHIPSFSWGGAEGFTTFKIEKAFEVAERVMQRRKIPFTDADKAILTSVFELEVAGQKQTIEARPNGL